MQLPPGTSNEPPWHWEENLEGRSFWKEYMFSKPKALFFQTSAPVMQPGLHQRGSWSEVGQDSGGVSSLHWSRRKTFFRLLPLHDANKSRRIKSRVLYLQQLSTHRWNQTKSSGIDSIFKQCSLMVLHDRISWATGLGCNIFLWLFRSGLPFPFAFFSKNSDRLPEHCTFLPQKFAFPTELSG